MAPVSTVPELLDSEQLAARGLLVTRSTACAIRVPSWPPRADPGWPALGAAPAVGAHTDEVLAATPRRPPAARAGATPSQSAAPPSGRHRHPDQPGAARRRQGRRPHLVHGRAGHHPHAGRLGRHRRAGRVDPPARRRAGFGAVPRRPPRPRRRRLRPHPQLGQAGPRPRPDPARRPSRARGSDAVGRRGRRQLQPPGHPQPGPRLADVVGRQPPAGAGQHVPDGPDRPAGRVRRIRQPVGRHRRLLRDRRLARPGAGRALPGLHRRDRPPLHVLRHPRRPRRAPPQRAGSLPRRVPGRVDHVAAGSGHPRGPAQRRGAHPGRQRRPQPRAPRGVPGRRRGQLGGGGLHRG